MNTDLSSEDSPVWPDDLKARLQAAPRLAPSPGFKDRVLFAAHAQNKENSRLRTIVAAAACLILALGVSVLFTEFGEKADPVLAAHRGVEWLLETQQDDGSWDVAQQGGKEDFRTGVSALSLMALLHSPEAVSTDALVRAGQYLERELIADRGNRYNTASRYNQLMALQSLISLESRHPDRERRRLLHEELNALLRQQQVDGGWGYEEQGAISYGNESLARSNSAVTFWVLQTLERATKVGFHAPRRSRSAARTWLATCFDGANHPRYRPDLESTTSPEHALYWMASLEQGSAPASSFNPQSSDVYRDFLMRQVPQAPTDDIRVRLIQAQAGDGSWQQDDRWGTAGGSVYQTAAAILTLAPSAG